MKYTIKAHPTWYKGVRFRSRLEARWACFFDVINWEWQYEPLDLEGWTPDFRVEFHCGHTGCPRRSCGQSSHVLLVEVKPYSTIDEFSGHPCMDYFYGGYAKERGGHGLIPADSSAAFGISPSVTYWEMEHGAGAGCDTLENWTDPDNSIEAMWHYAGNVTQWKPQNAR